MKARHWIQRRARRIKSNLTPCLFNTYCNIILSSVVRSQPSCLRINVQFDWNCGHGLCGCGLHLKLNIILLFWLVFGLRSVYRRVVPLAKQLGFLGGGVKFLVNKHTGQQINNNSHIQYKQHTDILHCSANICFNTFSHSGHAANVPTARDSALRL